MMDLRTETNLSEVTDKITNGLLTEIVSDEIPTDIWQITDVPNSINGTDYQLMGDRQYSVNKIDGLSTENDPLVIHH